MRIETVREHGVTVVSLHGVVTLGESAREVSDLLRTLLDEERGSVLVDLEAVDHVDSTGLGELVGYLQRFSEQGRRMALLSPPERVRNLLRLTKLDEVFPCFTDRADAIESMRG
jgi:anti-sigma B factor antagonist